MASRRRWQPGYTRWAAAGLVLISVGTLWQFPEVRYVAGAAVAEGRMLLSAQPVSRVLSRVTATPAEKQQLVLVRDVKAYAIEKLGLAPSDSYETFFDTSGRPLGWAVQAAYADRLEAYQWHYPILGAVPYKGFFTPEEAAAEAGGLEAAGFDTTMWAIPAFSTLGWLPDPVTSNLLQEEPAVLAATIIHELFHGTLYYPGDGNLNETMAQFVGQKGAEEYFPAGSEQHQRALDLWRDEQQYTRFMVDVVQQLDKIYQSPLSRAQKLARRRQVLRDAVPVYRTLQFLTPGYARFRPDTLNNARILGYLGYHSRVDRFEEAYRLVGSRTRRLVEFLQRVDPVRGLDSAIEELRRDGPDAWLASHEVRPAPIDRHTLLPRLQACACLLALLALQAGGRRWLAVPRSATARGAGSLAYLGMAAAACRGLLLGLPSVVLVPWVLGLEAITAAARFGLKLRRRGTGATETCLAVLELLGLAALSI